MNGYLVMTTIFNVGLFAITMLFASGAQEGRPQGTETGLAMMAVRSELDNLEPMKFGDGVRITGSCAQDSGDLIAVMGRADSSNESQLVDGFPVTQTTQFTFRAEVSANCQPYNLNCYSVEMLDIDGSLITTPRI